MPGCKQRPTACHVSCKARSAYLRRMRANLSLPLVALSGVVFLVSGTCSCTASGDLAVGFVMGFMAAAIATTIGIWFCSLSRDPSASGFFTSVAVSSYVASWFGAWWEQEVWIGIIAVPVTLVGGYAAFSVAQKEYHPRRSVVCGTAAVSTVAIALAVVTVCTGFWANFDFKSFHIIGGFDASFNPVPFALIAGAVPPVTAVVAARICGIICRRQAG